MLGVWRTTFVKKFPCLNPTNRTTVHNLQEATTVGDMGKYIHRINVSLEGRQVDHQSTVVEIEGKIQKQTSLYPNRPRGKFELHNPIISRNCKLEKVKHPKSWLVQLATGTKRKVSEYISKCDIGINDQNTLVNLNVLPLGSYDILIGMDWLESHKVLLNCYENHLFIKMKMGKKNSSRTKKTSFSKTIIIHAA
jgi:hypothetical protein